ncbi:MAG TPA: pilus assembly protein TadG-related protein [Sphingobium sp.]|uniref:beta strand repeat-containing protein n=1 Tax=Sphingobium sp. TaxID=1912891 RepID=UPI002ED671EF
MGNALYRPLGALWNDRRGGVSIIGVFTLVSLVGIAALSVDLGRGYQTKIAYQGAADAAALAAANAYTTNQNDALMSATAKDIGLANGISAGNVTVTHLTSYSATVSHAVQVVMTANVPLYFARIFSSAASYPVSVTAVASLSTTSTPPCILALSSSSSGITLSGGTRITAPTCAVISNTKIDVSGGSTINAKSTTSTGATSVSGGSSITAATVTYGTTISTQAGSSISGTTTQKAGTTPDPLASNSGLAAAFALLGTYTAPTVPSVPTGDDLTLGYYPTTMTFQGRTASLSGNVWAFPAGTYNIRNLNTQSLTLNIAGPSTVTVSGGVTVGGGGALIIGDGSVSINAPVALGGGTKMTVGAGRHYIGQLSVSGGSSATFGAGDLDVNGAVLVDGGGSSVTFGAGNYAIGNNGSGTAISLSGGSTLSFGNGTFSANGAIVTAGGSSITFGATANHLINGNLSLNGSSTFGAGTYTINGYFTNNTGGTMTGSNVSFILAGSLNASGGTSINLSAPSSGALADILFATRSTAATVLGGGTQDIFSGIIYAPGSDFKMSGGATASGSCFTIIASTVTLASGPAAATACPSLSGSSSSATVGLIQ